MTMTRPNKMMGKIFTSAHRAIYKLSKGKIGGSQGGGTVAVLTTTGAKSGKQREVPIIVDDDGDGWIVVASFAGHDENPGWYHNLNTNPQASLLIGNDTHPVVATELEGGARQAAWDQMVKINSDYAEYQKVTERQIPVLRLAKN